LGNMPAPDPQGKFIQNGLTPYRSQ
jgi:hypothetical protein